MCPGIGYVESAFHGPGVCFIGASEKGAFGGAFRTPSRVARLRSTRYNGGWYRLTAFPPDPLKSAL